MESTPREKKTIGVVLGSLGDLFQAHVWPGIVDAARELNLGIILYSGKIPETPFLSKRELGVVYGFPSADRLDGIILFSAVLFNFVTEDEFRQSIDRYGTLPLVSLSRVAEGHPSVLVENTEGMLRLVRHFVRDHGYRRIAFIRGPEGSVEAEERFSAYRQALAEAGIPYDPELVAQGYFLPEGGIEAARILLEERKVPFDAVIAANDGSLLGALNFFRNRWLSVPEDFAVGGFDDVDEARIHSPPLTTVNQSLYTLGRTSCELLRDLMEGVTVPEITRIPTRLVIRRSCGCAEQDDHFEPDSPVAAPPTRAESLQGETPIARRIRATLSSRLAAEARGERPEISFVDTFTAIVDNSALDTAELRVITDILAVLHEWAGTRAPEEQERIRSSLECAAFTLREYAGRTNNWQQFANQLSFMKTLSKALPTAFTLTSIFRILETSLTELGITFCLVSFPEGECSVHGIFADPPERSRLAFAWKDGKRFPLPEEGIAFRSRELGPGELAPQRGKGTLIVFPLMYNDEYLGFMVCNYPTAGGIIISLEFLHEQLSAAIKTTLMFDDLKKAQMRLLHTEKMASLGELTAGIAHELKNPLNFVNNFAEGMFGYIDELEALVDPKQEIASIIADLRAAAGSIERHGKKADKIIRSMLNQARGDTGRFEKTKIETLIHDSATLAWQSFKIQWPDVAVEIIEDYSDSLPEVMANPSQLNRVFINLLSNALYAMQQRSRRENGYRAVLTLTARLSGNNMEIRITDNGIGIREDNMPMLFQPFFTTKPNNEGTGLGLKICRDIVVDGHGGTIDVESREGVYTTFIIVIPINSATN